MQCIYALRHKTTGRFYIGSTKDLDARTMQWRQAFRYNKAPKKLLVLSRTLAAFDIVVLEEITDTAQLRWHETMFILRALMLMPERVLNKQAHNFAPAVQVAKSTYYDRLSRGYTPEQALSPRALGWAAKTIVVDDDQKRITQAHAAELLGCRPKTLERRLRNHRKSHPYASQVTLDYLRKGSSTRN